MFYIKSICGYLFSLLISNELCNKSCLRYAASITYSSTFNKQIKIHFMDNTTITKN